MPKTVAIVGVSGFSGAELARLVSSDGELALTGAYSDRMRGGTVAGGVIVRPQADADRAAEEAEIIALATPAEVSAELAPRLLAKGARVIDLSGAFRLPDTSVFLEYYRFEHPEPALLAEAHYGLPQLPKTAGEAPAIEQARIVANPGCYATAAILALAPLASAGALDGGPVFVDGKSGVTGAGRKLAERYLFTEVAENVSLYRVVDHQHVPEIELALRRVSGVDVRVTFAPHLLPIRRGLITTCFGRLGPSVDPEAVEGAVRSAYAASSPFVRVVPIDTIDVHAVTHTPEAHVGVKVDRRGRSVVSACALDNLMKGAASQAWENIRRMCGLAARAA
ncbi:MAG: N-acetyl-gamma-glutamyl-phosphate reductase [Polyangiaceae bacterium]|jgi:N-acetyl-gamma-glutamyl-phosphate reductase|nr:N-acetyl-gamma-glutamyl-phosphate reductase [Polyangiaceae bacterium]MBK8942782.1 N-acetyl-gamma-glutamyl-phosphate reductase [Polyangiaceae bacterium]